MCNLHKPFGLKLWLSLFRSLRSFSVKNMDAVKKKKGCIHQAWLIWATLCGQCELISRFLQYTFNSFCTITSTLYKVFFLVKGTETVKELIKTKFQWQKSLKFLLVVQIYIVFPKNSAVSLTTTGHFGVFQLIVLLFTWLFWAKWALYLLVSGHSEQMFSKKSPAHEIFLLFFQEIGGD